MFSISCYSQEPSVFSIKNSMYKILYDYGDDFLCTKPNINYYKKHGGNPYDKIYPIHIYNIEKRNGVFIIKGEINVTCSTDRYKNEFKNSTSFVVKGKSFGDDFITQNLTIDFLGFSKQLFPSKN